MKIAIVCDWLTGMRGGEKCLKALCELYPKADIFTLVYYPEKFNSEFESHRVTTSFIQKLPCNAQTFQRYLPLFPKAIQSFDLSGYDIVVSFSHCVAKSVIAPKHVPHICYCHTPVRYAWDMRDQYLNGMNFLKRTVVSFILNRFKKWDAATADRADSFLANSKYIQQRITRCYDRNSQVVYPPVNVSRFSVSDHNQGYYLILSAMVPYKRIDLAIQAFNLNGKHLIIAGGGCDCKHLMAMAESNIEFIVYPDNQKVEQLYMDCKALIFPGEEDFGIVPLEAQACGKPVIAFAKGGALETVIGVNEINASATGVFFFLKKGLGVEKSNLKFLVIEEDIKPGKIQQK
jgi:glycosyltransferase involved in cell wall biosynthesis